MGSSQVKRTLPDQRNRLAYGELCLMNLIWDNEPISSGALAEKCREKLGWKKSTTYTRLKLLEGKGFLRNENAVVTALLRREEARSTESKYVVEQAFGGSLPAFLTAFLGGSRLSDGEVEELKALIEAYRED